MAKLLDQYLEKQNQIENAVAEGKTSVALALMSSELIYRISVLKTFRMLCKTTPITSDIPTLRTHYQLVDAYVRLLISEHKLGVKTDVEGQKKRDAAAAILARVIQDGRRRFGNFQTTSEECYSKEISVLINAILPVWIQYRNTFIPI